MLDWKEFFPVQALAPFIGGLLLWFGLNYIYLAPSVIAPRLAERHFIPACLSSVGAMETAFVDRVKTMDEAFRDKLKEQREAMLRKMSSGAAAGLGMLFGDSPEARRLARAWQPHIENQMGGSMVQMQIEQEMTKVQNAYEAEKQRQVGELRSKQKFTTRREYCGCTAAEGLGNRIETALYTSTLRLYTPATVARLAEGGPTGESCGAPPVVK